MVTIVFSLLSCKFWFCLRPNGETEKQKKKWREENICDMRIKIWAKEKNNNIKLVCFGEKTESNLRGWNFDKLISCDSFSLPVGRFATICYRKFLLIIKYALVTRIEHGFCCCCCCASVEHFFIWIWVYIYTNEP